MLPQVLPLGRVAVGLPLHLLLPLIVANTDVTSTDASSVLGATLNMILTRPQAPLTADSATGPAHGSLGSSLGASYWETLSSTSGARTKNTYATKHLLGTLEGNEKL